MLPGWFAVLSDARSFLAWIGGFDIFDIKPWPTEEFGCHSCLSET